MKNNNSLFKFKENNDENIIRTKVNISRGKNTINA